MFQTQSDHHQDKNSTLSRDQGILLEAGTNELELLVFKLGNTPFGINVAKVREIIQPCKTISIPQAPPAVEGTIRVRDEILTLINLGRHFSMTNHDIDPCERMVIIVELNDTRCAVLVDEVQRIHRLAWDCIQAPSQYLTDLQAPVTGIVNIENQVVLVVDFETIIGEILDVHCIRLENQPDDTASDGSRARLLLVDDSTFVRATLERNLRNRGYQDLIVCTDGQHAWETLDAQRHVAGGPCDLVVSDIEMPRMDGLHLTSRIKGDSQLKHIPVVLFSSLITSDNLKKGRSVGADAQVSKPNGEEMMQAIEECLLRVSKKEGMMA